jgi:transposase
MIGQDKRKAIYLLNEEGMGIRDISRRMGIDKNTVRAIVEQKGDIPDKKRKDKIAVSPGLLQRLYVECDGWKKRVMEKLEEEEGIKVKYSTLTRIIRELGISKKGKERCYQVADEPGVEMQHDTSGYRLKIGEKLVKVVCSILYFRYSKKKYVKFYRSFNRFKMKCFLHEALMNSGYSARNCIIDNTNLARLRGTGKNAIIVEEMDQFAKQYGFKFICHEVRHSNRKAGEERSFYTVETNFISGRRFKSFEDLNQQAFDWATIKMVNTPVGKTGLIPAKAFEHEKSYLVKVHTYIPAPYDPHRRTIDQYGYAAFNGNYYWIPGKERGDVLLLEYAHCIKIYRNRELLVKYSLPADGVKHEQFSPHGMPKPKYMPKYHHNPTQQEEKILRSQAKEINDYLDSLHKSKGKQRHAFIRELFGLYKKISLPLFTETVKRALRYRITDIKTIERIAILKMNDTGYEVPLIEIDDEFENRQTYLEGRMSDKPDLSIYDKMLEEQDNG